MAIAQATFFDLGDTLAAPRIDAHGHLAGLDVFPFVAEILKIFSTPVAFGGLGHGVGLISNTGKESQSNLINVLKAAGLLDLLDRSLLLFSSVEGLDKRQVEFFILAAARAGIAPKKCLFVGENDQDRSTAAAAGMRVSFHPLHALYFARLASH